MVLYPPKDEPVLTQEEYSKSIQYVKQKMFKENLGIKRSTPKEAMNALKAFGIHLRDLPKLESIIKNEAGYKTTQNLPLYLLIKFYKNGGINILGGLVTSFHTDSYGQKYTTIDYMEIRPSYRGRGYSKYLLFCFLRPNQPSYIIEDETNGLYRRWGFQRLSKIDKNRNDRDELEYISFYNWVGEVEEGARPLVNLHPNATLTLSNIRTIFG